MLNRRMIAPMLAKKFDEDYKTVMQHYTIEEQIELTKHLINIVELFQEYQKDVTKDPFKSWQQEERILQEKYRDRLQPLKAKSFYKYFNYDIVITEKELFSPEEFNKMQPEEQVLTEKEIDTFLTLCHKDLNNALDYLYLEPADDKIKKEKPMNKEEAIGDMPDKEITRSRQMLTIYYLLKAGFDIEHRKNSNVSDVAKFIHLFTGTKFNGLSSSEIYKKYKAIPNHKEGTELIKDLKFIRPYFQSLEINKAVELINADIEKALKDIPLNERKKYRGA
jgi:hypothetical protein